MANFVLQPQMPAVVCACDTSLLYRFLKIELPLTNQINLTNMATINNNLYRYADIAPEFEVEFFPKRSQDRTPIKPLQAGETLPSFHIHKKNIIATSDTLKTLNGSLPVTQVIDRPLVLAFHSIHWNNYGNTLLEKLQEVYADIRVLGGQLVVATTDDKQTFENATAQYQLPFATIFDQYNGIAKKAGLYATTDPIWDRVAGIEADVPVPGIYVLTPSLKIVYASVDKWFDQPFAKEALLEALEAASQEQEHAIAI